MLRKRKQKQNHSLEPPRPRRKLSESEREQEPAALHRVSFRGDGIEIDEEASRNIKRVRITKERAKSWLQHVDPSQQRPTSKHWIEALGRVMNAGDYRNWIEDLAFDKLGRLINGAHTLNAFIDSDLEALAVNMSINHEPEDFDAYDKNRRKTLRDDLRHDGVAKAGDVASVISVVWQWERGLFDGMRYLTVRGGGQFPQSAEGRRVFAAHPGMTKHLYKNPVRTGCRYSLGAMRAGALIIHEEHPKKAAEFMEAFLAGAGIPTQDYHNHPVWRLRDELLNRSKDDKTLSAGDTLARFLKAFNLFMDKQSVTGRSLLAKGEAFPKLGEPAQVIPMKASG